MKMKNKAIPVVMVLIGVYIFAPIVSAETAEEWNEKGISFGTAGEDEIYFLGKAGECEKAIECFDKAIELDPNYAEAYNNRGLVYYRCLNQYERAIEDFNKSIELNPHCGNPAYDSRKFAFLRKSEEQKPTKSSMPVVTETPTPTSEEKGVPRFEAIFTFIVGIFSELVKTANTPPNLAITAPPNNSIFVEGDEVTFAGTATDTEDANDTLKIEWPSNKDGVLDRASPDAGGNICFSLNSLSVNTHTITLKVTDSRGASSSIGVNITVEELQSEFVPKSIPQNRQIIPSNPGPFIVSVDSDGYINSPGRLYVGKEYAGNKAIVQRRSYGGYYIIINNNIVKGQP